MLSTMRPLISRHIQPARYTAIRCFGVMDFVNSKIDKTKDNNFKKMIDEMIATPEWSLRTWKDSLERQLGSWMMYIPGMSSSTDVTQMKSFKAILEKLTPAELANDNLIKGPVRERLAISSGESVDNVAKMLYFYKQTKIMATWLKLRTKENEPIPSNEFELQEMQESDIRLRSIARMIMAPKGQKTGRSKQLPF